MTRLSFFLSTAALCVGASSAAAQTTHTVDLVGLSFSPANITIAQGDTVEWNWVTGIHNVDSDDGLFTSGAPVPPPATFSITFDAAFLASAPANGNVYDYHCDPHEFLGMVGSVTVTTNNPVLTVTNFVAGQTTSLTVTGAAAGGTVGYAYSLSGPGPVTVNAGGCGAVTASLSAPFTLLPQATADASGTAVLSSNLPAGTSGLPVWIQAMDLTGCALSNGATMTIG